MFKYFVSYTYYLHDGSDGTGNAFSELDREIRGVNEIKYIEDALESQLRDEFPNLKGKPVIMWFQRLNS